MGMDIYSKSGIVFAVEDISARLFGKAKKSDVVEVVNSLKNNWVEDWGDQNLDDVQDASGLADWFSSFASSQVRDDYLDDRVLGPVWELITQSLGIQDLPRVDFEYWTHSRISGWDVPIETPCVVFDESGLFETKMTKEGKKFAKAIGQKEVNSTTWTVMSV